MFSIITMRIITITIIIVTITITVIIIRRVHVAILVFIGLITNYMLRVNINMTIEYMTK